jgi:hypothetical protein
MAQRQKLPPLPMRRENDPNDDPEIWQPNYLCFCCEDTGLAMHAAVMFIEGYDLDKHKFPVCQNPGCENGLKFGQVPALENSLDWRLDAQMCAEADQAKRKEWRKWAKQQLQKRHFLEIDLSTITKNLRKRSRTSAEEMEAWQKHQAVLSELNAL